MSSTLVRLSSAVLAGLKQSRHISRARFSGFVSTQSGSEEAAAFPFPFPGPFHSTSIDMSNERTPSPTEIEDGLREWETAVSTEQLTAMEKRIHDSHMQAVLVCLHKSHSGERNAVHILHLNRDAKNKSVKHHLLVSEDDLSVDLFGVVLHCDFTIRKCRCANLSSSAYNLLSTRSMDADHQEIYHDPVTGFQVYTSYGHLKRGSCCGNACRHCPYEHQNVAPRYKSIKRNNGAFYC